MKNIGKWIVYIAAFTICISFLVFKDSLLHASAKQDTYTISTSTTPINKKMKKYTTYSAETKNYYTIRSYLEKLESDGGGTLILKRGTYRITNTLFVPSNVTIQLNDGVILEKSMDTGNDLKPSKSLFQLVAPSIAKNGDMMDEYNGSKNVTITSNGKATIDLKENENVNGIITGHNKNLTIKNIQFTNANEGYFIQLVANQNAKIQNNSFTNETSFTKPAISIETADFSYGTYKVNWSMYDETPNSQVLIEKNTFDQVYQAISSNNFTVDTYQLKVRILNNKIKNTESNAITMKNWKLPTVEKNIIQSVNNGYGIYVKGTYKPVIQNNQFLNMDIPVLLAAQTGSNEQSNVNTITYGTKKALASNEGKDLQEFYMHIENNAAEPVEKIEITDMNDLGKDEYKVTPETVTLNKEYLLRPSYTPQTKQYYALRSYMEQLEKQGGGKIIFTKGVYTISNVLYVPSNVTLEFEDGTEIVKGDETGTPTMNPSSSIFQLIRPSLSKKERAVSGHNGEKNISFIGKGKVVFNLNFKLSSFAIIMGHNKNVHISNIQFRNMNAGHFIEMDASEDVTIANSQFIDSKPSDRFIKEAINIDTPDKTTLGWSSKWSNFDCTANNRINIINNKFVNLDRAIGTHKYSGGHLHTNVVIRGNLIDTTRNDAIRIMNWKTPIIEKNDIRNVAVNDSKKRGILSSGAINPKIRNNTFTNVGRAIQFIAWKNNGPGEQYEEIKDVLTDEEKELLKTNQLFNTTENFIRISSVYAVYTKPEKIIIKHF
ncbi:NosD domain-containing protein [Rummeliibacillus pycnus]|uniref:NosD domain-containing protein n=1 Tax=Rummeliibacillus pycnus TaxID=101070 RepID=UPI000C9C7044|nr:right-handed parallel beta-helix repeat-containing protein [Rummeliibacillus pycnus]